ncbi:hypothetical protein JTB14_005337 [Gonioctena quinquepunctata]|nr:hypothetical protein JTB14_005337 [Gonioctena quinquepunctata]
MCVSEEKSHSTQMSFSSNSVPVGAVYKGFQSQKGIAGDIRSFPKNNGAYRRPNGTGRERSGVSFAKNPKEHQYKQQKGLGCFSEKYHIELKDDCKPVMNPPRKVPLPSLSKLEHALKELEEQCIKNCWGCWRTDSLK